MTRRTGLMLLLAFGCSVALGSQTVASQNSPPEDQVEIYSSIAPPFITPGKSVFVTREGDPFVLTVTSTCLLEDDSEAQFELLSSSPSFVHVSQVYKRENRENGYTEGMGVVYVTPQIGDAGTHTVSLQIKACNGKVERVITFKVKVKPGRIG